ASCCLRPCSGCIPSCRHCSLTPAIKGANSTTRSKKSCLTCERRSSSARIRPKDSWCCPSAGSLSGRWRGSTAAADSPRIGRTSIAQRSLFCASPQSSLCSENFVILTDVSGRTLRREEYSGDMRLMLHEQAKVYAIKNDKPIEPYILISGDDKD